MHVHANEDEGLYVLEGDFRCRAATRRAREPRELHGAGAEAGMGVSGPPLALTHPGRDESGAGGQS